MRVRRAAAPSSLLGEKNARYGGGRGGIDRSAGRVSSVGPARGAGHGRGAARRGEEAGLPADDRFWAPRHARVERAAYETVPRGGTGRTLGHRRGQPRRSADRRLYVGSARARRAGRARPRRAPLHGARRAGRRAGILALTAGDATVTPL